LGEERRVHRKIPEGAESFADGLIGVLGGSVEVFAVPLTSLLAPSTVAMGRLGIGLNGE